jgi:anti-anti-sigma factor
MAAYRHLRVLCPGRVTVVRLLDSTCTYFSNGTDTGLELVRIADTPDCRVLILDFSSVKMIDSQLLACLISVHQRLKRKQGSLRLRGLRPNLRELFERTHLDQVIHTDELRPAVPVGA